jgi:hypothetical protein
LARTCHCRYTPPLRYECISSAPACGMISRFRRTSHPSSRAPRAKLEHSLNQDFCTAMALLDLFFFAKNLLFYGSLSITFRTPCQTLIIISNLVYARLRIRRDPVFTGAECVSSLAAHPSPLAKDVSSLAPLAIQERVKLRV